MARTIPWRKTLGARLAACAIVLAAVGLLLAGGSLYMLRSAEASANWTVHSAEGHAAAYQVLCLTNRFLEEPTPDGRDRVRADLARVLDDAEHRPARLQTGDPARGIPAATDPAIRANLQTRADLWRTEIRPTVDAITRKADRAGARAELGSLDRLAQRLGELVAEANALEDAAGRREARRFQVALAALAGLALATVGLVYWTARRVVARARSLADTADRIAAGELDQTAAGGGSNELAALAESFNTMTANLRATIEAEKERRALVEHLLGGNRESVAQLAAASAEILASTTQQAAGAQEQAAAVSQTVTTVDEVLQTSEHAAQRARAVGEAVQAALETGRAGRTAVDDSIAALGTVRERVEATAEAILALAEQAQTIGEIIATVNDIAERTNLLALNAAIEASRAGEHGRGFAVVAGEVKALADQSKRATAQVRQILGEIQKGTNTAVLSTEDVTKGVTAATQVADQAGGTIKALAETLNQTAQAAAQIVASAGQQATGMAQIHQAMRNIDQVARQNLAAMRQAEQAARDLNALGTRLSQLGGEQGGRA